MRFLNAEPAVCFFFVNAKKAVGFWEGDFVREIPFVFKVSCVFKVALESKPAFVFLFNAYGGVAFGKGDFMQKILCKRFASTVECKIVRTDSLWLYFSSMLLGIQPELMCSTH